MKFNDEYHRLRQEMIERDLLARARRGDWQAIQGVLLVLHEALADNAPLTPACAEYLAEALQKIEQGADAQKVFHGNRKPGDKDLRKPRGAAFMNACRIEYQRMQNKLTVEEALGHVAVDTGLSEGTLQSQWKEHHKSARQELERQQQALGHLIPI